jgi:hypothetical protein
LYQDKAQDLPRTSTDDDAPAPRLKVGTKVRVRNRFLGDWSTGFTVAEVLHEGYRIRRLSDSHAFPDVFSFEDVRVERRKHPLREMIGSHLDRRQ